MRIKATIIVTFKALASQWKQVLLVYAILPIMLAMAMGYFQKDAYKPDTQMDKVSITIKDMDNSILSNAFKEIFNIDEVKKLFTVCADGDYVVNIPKGYENNITHLKKTSISINEKKRSSSLSELALENLIMQYGKNVSQTEFINSKINTLNIHNKKALLTKLVSTLNVVDNAQSIQNKILKGERILSSYENEAASLITFMIITMAFGCVAGFHMDKENGSFKRLISTPMTKATFFNLDLLIFFLSNLIYSLLYIAGFAITGLAFRHTNPLVLILITICQSAVVSTMAGLFVAYFKKQLANMILLIIMYSQIFLGGAFIPLKDVGELFQNISKYMPGNIISNAYKNSILSNSFSSILQYLGIMLLTSLIFFILSIAKINSRWED